MDAMNDKQWIILKVMIACMFVLLVIHGAAVLYEAFTTDKAQAEGQIIKFNGQTLDLSGASNVMVQSSNDQRVFAADEQGGVVTVTTNIVTVTVWAKP